MDSDDARCFSLWAGAVLPSQLPPAGLSLQHSPPSPSLSLPCCQVFLWAPWMWCWTPAPGWPRTASCTRPRIHRSIGQWRAVGALSHQGRWGRPDPEGAGPSLHSCAGRGLLLPFTQSFTQHRPGQHPPQQGSVAVHGRRAGGAECHEALCLAKGLALGSVHVLLTFSQDDTVDHFSCTT